jgi:hypothetical protein
MVTGKRKVIGCMKADLGKKYLMTGSQTGEREYLAITEV